MLSIDDRCIVKLSVAPRREITDRLIVVGEEEILSHFRWHGEERPLLARVENDGVDGFFDDFVEPLVDLFMFGA